MRQPRIAMIADRLTALLPEDGLTVSRHDVKARLMYDDWTITEREFEGAVALAAVRRQITSAFGGAVIARFNTCLDIFLKKLIRVFVAVLTTESRG